MDQRLAGVKASSHTLKKFELSIGQAEIMSRCNRLAELSLKHGR
jgi:hypothetical protein